MRGGQAAGGVGRHFKIRDIYQGSQEFEERRLISGLSWRKFQEQSKVVWSESDRPREECGRMSQVKGNSPDKGTTVGNDERV